MRRGRWIVVVLDGSRSLDRSQIQFPVAGIGNGRQCHAFDRRFFLLSEQQLSLLFKGTSTGAQSFFPVIRLISFVQSADSDDHFVGIESPFGRCDSRSCCCGRRALIPGRFRRFANGAPFRSFGAGGWKDCDRTMRMLSNKRNQRRPIPRNIVERFAEAEAEQERRWAKKIAWESRQ